MKKLSAGILVYRKKDDQVEVLLAHHGGPIWAKKDNGAWSIIKGEYEGSEEPFDAAKREFKEETSHDAPTGKYIDLGKTERKDKIISAWAGEADFDSETIKSDTFSMEWPPRSGKKQEFPENDRAEWFNIKLASPKMHTGQSVFLERLADILGVPLDAKEVSMPPTQSTLF